MFTGRRVELAQDEIPVQLKLAPGFATLDYQIEALHRHDQLKRLTQPFSEKVMETGMANSKAGSECTGSVLADCSVCLIEEGTVCFAERCSFLSCGVGVFARSSPSLLRCSASIFLSQRRNQVVSVQSPGKYHQIEPSSSAAPCCFTT